MFSAIVRESSGETLLCVDMYVEKREIRREKVSR
jgi:hypothetical protein